MEFSVNTWETFFSYLLVLMLLFAGFLLCCFRKRDHPYAPQLLTACDATEWPKMCTTYNDMLTRDFALQSFFVCKPALVCVGGKKFQWMLSPSTEIRKRQKSLRRKFDSFSKEKKERGELNAHTIKKKVNSCQGGRSIPVYDIFLWVQMRSYLKKQPK